VRAAGGTLLRHAYDIEVVGLENVPRSGPAILAANHRSFMDSLFIAVVAPRPVSFLAKAEYFDRRRTRWIFRHTGQIPVRRGNTSGTRNALRAAVDVLDRGGVLGVYPEGTRSRDGLLHSGTGGAVYLAAVSGAPIIPIGLTGTEAVQPPDRVLPTVGGRVRIRIGTPLRPDRRAAHRRRRQDATAQLMESIGGLCDQQPLASPRTVTAR
jgi:1-acyl-sn-glycerol-3-phosphate acyltransferase